MRRLSGFGAFVRRGGAPKGLQGGNGAGGVTAHRPRGGTAPPEGSRRGLGWDGGGSVLPRRCHTAAIWGRPRFGDGRSVPRRRSAPEQRRERTSGARSAFHFPAQNLFFLFSFLKNPPTEPKARCCLPFSLPLPLRRRALLIRVNQNAPCCAGGVKLRWGSALLCTALKESSPVLPGAASRVVKQ